MPFPFDGNYGAQQEKRDLLLARADLTPPSLDRPHESSNFTVSCLATLGLNLWLGEKLNLSTSLAIDGDVANLDDSTKAANQSFYPREWIRVLRIKDISLMFESLAASMTRTVRMTNLDSQRSGMNYSYRSPFWYFENSSYWDIQNVGPASGNATYSVVLVEIRWGWLSLPVALPLLSIVFFGLTALLTARNDLQIWKSSPLPLILSGIGMPDTEGPENGTPKTVKQMERIASSMPVTLKNDDRGHRLTRE